MTVALRRMTALRDSGGRRQERPEAARGASYCCVTQWMPPSECARVQAGTPTTRRRGKAPESTFSATSSLGSANRGAITAPLAR